MTTADVDRLYDLIADLRDEIHGYRADLNGRLRALETSEAARDAMETHRSVTVGHAAMWASAIVAATGLLTTFLLHFTHLF